MIREFQREAQGMTQILKKPKHIEKKTIGAYLGLSSKSSTGFLSSNIADTDFHRPQSSKSNSNLRSSSANRNRRLRQSADFTQGKANKQQDPHRRSSTPVPTSPVGN